MKTRWLLAVALVLVVDAGTADAQRRGRGGGAGFHFMPMDHKLEVSGLWGYSWTSDYEVYNVNLDTNGKFDIKSNDHWGVEVDVNVRPGAQLVLAYDRMSSRVTFQPTRPPGQKRELGDIDVEYWQIGGISGPFNGKFMPYGGMTVGGTRFIGGGEDAWKFSFVPQLGAKFYASPRIALRVHARFPITLIDSGFGFGFGTGGSYASVNGTGVVAADLGGGISILLGS